MLISWTGGQPAAASVFRRPSTQKEDAATLNRMRTPIVRIQTSRRPEPVFF